MTIPELELTHQKRGHWQALKKIDAIIDQFVGSDVETRQVIVRYKELPKVASKPAPQPQAVPPQKKKKKVVQKVVEVVEEVDEEEEG